MDFTNLEENAREAKLDYGEAESLVRFFSFQRERQGEPQISSDYGRLCEQLSGIYSGVSFEYAGYRIIARGARGVSGSLVKRIGFVSSRIPHLATTIDIGSDSFLVVFRVDGIGVIKEDSWYEFFDHDLDPEEVRRDCEDDEDAIDDFLRDHFHEQICPQMEDPFFDPSGEGCELYFETGSKDELERLMRIFILTEPDIQAHEDEDVRLYAAMDGTEPHLESSDCYRSERLEALTEIALSENRPVGWTWEYNDGAYNRRSGYDEFAESLTWYIAEILEQSPAREKMAARRELRKWLEARSRYGAVRCAGGREESRMNRLNSVATRMGPDLRNAIEAMPGLGGVALWVKFLDSDETELIACTDGIHFEAGPRYKKYDDAERRFVVGEANP